MRSPWAFGIAFAVSLGATPALAAPEVRKGPWLMDAHPDSIAVLVELSEPAALEVEVTGGGLVEPRVGRSSARALHEVVVDGLTPATRYDYVVRPEGGRETGGSFETAPTPGDGPIHFLVVGDNRSDALAHAAIVRAMLDHPGEMVINTGDMVAHGDDPEHWAEMFEVQAPLLRVMPLFPTLGNHELYEDGAGLASFRRYTRVPRDHGGGETWYGFDWGPVRFFVLDSNDDWSTPGPQRAWIEEQLAAAADDPSVRHVIVAMHHGPCSSGAHGPHEGMCETGLDDLLRRSGVALLLSGHDHTYERGDDDGLKYVVTGGGGAPLYTENVELPSQLAFQPVYHFLSIDVDGGRITVVPIRPDGSEIERCWFDENEPWQCEGTEGGRGPVAVSEVDDAGERALSLPAAWIAAAAIVVLGAGWLVWRRRRAPA